MNTTPKYDQPRMYQSLTNETRSPLNTLSPCAAFFSVALGIALLVNATLPTIFAQEIDAAAQLEKQRIQLDHLLHQIDPYHPKEGVAGSIKLAGSNTMVQMAQNWTQRFRMFHPNVEFQKVTDGTDAALEALRNDPTVIAGVSRAITEEELARLKSGKCEDPMIVLVALDPLAVYVHQDNPLPGLTPELFQSLFGGNAEGKPRLSSWAEAGVQGPIEKQPIQIHHRSEISGTRNYIGKTLLGGQPMADPHQTHTTNAAICQAIAKDKAGIGIAGFGDACEGIRALPLIVDGQLIEASETSFLNGNYSLVRPLSLVLDRAQLKKDGGLREAILRYILSYDGQSEAIRAGFYPLDPAFIRHELVQLTGTQLR